MSILRIRDHPTRPSTYFFFSLSLLPGPVGRGGEPNEYPYNARDGYRAGTRKSTFNIALMHDGEFIFRFCFFVDHCSHAPSPPSRDMVYALTRRICILCDGPICWVRWFMRYQLLISFPFPWFD